MLIRLTRFFLFALTFLLTGFVSAADTPTAESGAIGVEQTIAQAGAAGKFSLVIVSDASNKEFDAPTKEMRQAADNFAAEKTGKIEVIALDRTAKEAQPLVEKFALNRAPLPLLLVFAPNGAVTGGFPQRVRAEQLESALVSPATMQMMQKLQSGKLVFLNVRGKQTAGNAEADAGIREFAAAAGITPEQVTIDPADKDEEKMLAQLQLEPGVKQAVTLLLAPPGNLLGRFDGPVTGPQIFAAIQKARRSSCSDARCADVNCTPPAQAPASGAAPAATAKPAGK